MTITIEVHAIFLIFYSSKQEESPDSITKGQKSPMFKYIYIKEFYVLGSLELLQTFCFFIKENDRTW